MTELEKQLLEALKLALSSHGQILLTNPPQEAWQHNRVDEICRAAIAAAEAEQPVEGASGERLAAEMALSQQLAARVNDLEHQLATAPAVPEAIDLLRTMEWLYKPYDDYSHAPAGYYCPECEEMRESGHRDDCKLLALLAAAAAPTQEAGARLAEEAKGGE
ncbi:hypothetical protein [Chromobacterium haemolyticum]|uniref:Uncharacterized protein n=1 Tax=Chromobacterium haemolyticum TaxID=394935 RepID=A0A1W0CN83_9NEIS|nr:hypothetical protein [Chromobacterium haemolyticum]OQS36118.1 hypothetical protein B0T45_16685 [Chromobacterium haemolyticum]